MIISKNKEKGSGQNLTSISQNNPPQKKTNKQTTTLKTPSLKEPDKRHLKYPIVNI